MTKAPSPDTDLAGIRKTARVAYKADEYDRAVSLYEAVLAKAGEAGEAGPVAGDYIEYGSALSRATRIEDAAAAFEVAVKMEPNSLDARVRLARTLSRLQRPAPAAEHYRAALALSPDDPDHYVQLAGELRRLGSFEEAQSLLKQALIFDPDHVEAKLVLLALSRSQMVPRGETITAYPLDGPAMMPGLDGQPPLQLPPTRKAKASLPFWGVVALGAALAMVGLYVRSLFP